MKTARRYGGQVIHDVEYTYDPVFEVDTAITLCGKRLTLKDYFDPLPILKSGRRPYPRCKACLREQGRRF